MAPQNIMYDRRVVRGNTFAALVIPVNMQPDPNAIERQRAQEQVRKHNAEQRMMKRREEQFMQ